MTLFDIGSYFLTMIAIALAPGPVFLMLMVRAAGNDARGAMAFGLGYGLGGLIIISAFCFGLSAWLTAVPAAFDYSQYVMLAYILWMARKIWMGGFDLNSDGDTRPRGLLPSVLAGIATCGISPYMMILFPLVLPGLMDITTITMPSFLIVAVTTFAALFLGAGIIVIFASQLRRLVRSPDTAVTVNRALSGLLVLGGSWMALG